MESQANNGSCLYLQGFLRGVFRLAPTAIHKEQMKNRIGHVDIAKGISIILVAIFHSELASIYYNVLGPMSLFRMPLFFFLSGVFFSTKANLGAFLRKKSDALLKPYFVTLFLVFLVSGSLHNKFSLSGLIGIFYGTGQTIQWVPLWFLTHLFVVYCFVYFLFKFSGLQKVSLHFRYGVVVSLMCIGVSCIDLFRTFHLPFFGNVAHLSGLPFSLDIVLVTSFFFVLGVLMRQQVISFKPNSSSFLATS